MDGDGAHHHLRSHEPAVRRLGHGRSLSRRPAGDHLWLDQDGSAGTPILAQTGGSPYPEYLSYDVVSAAYPIVSPTRACIIGGGGGRDILKALQGGAKEVEVVELNPFTVDAVSRVFGAHSGDPYHLPGVHAFVGEGRNHFSRSSTPCDVIEISQIDTFAASAAGAYALTENSLYTVEAIRMFWSQLSDRGVLSVSRWVSGPAWPESVRLGPARSRGAAPGGSRGAAQSHAGPRRRRAPPTCCCSGSR